MHETAERYLAAEDPVLARVIGEVGPCLLRPRADRSPFESLVRAVAHQQLNGTAAATILDRFLGLFPRRRFPSAASVSAVSDDQLRGVGFSRAKVAAIRDIALRVLSGDIPGSREIGRLEDAEIIRRLTAARGVGRWTVEMLLIFKLGRPDVLPVDDFGVRSGFRLMHGLTDMPSPRDLERFGERWKPHRTVAAWYLWRAVDLSREGRLPPPVSRITRSAGRRSGRAGRP